MKKTLIFITAVLLSMSLPAQHYSIDGTVPAFKNSNVYLMQITMDKQTVIDTARSDSEGNFHFDLPEELPIGMYRIFSHRKMMDIIYHNENIRFVSNGNEENNIQIIESVENMLYYKYLYIKNDNQNKLSILQPVLAQYPKNDTFYSVLYNQVNKLQNQIEETAENIIYNYRNLLVAHYVKVDKPPVIDLSLPPEQQKKWIIKHYFDDMDFADSTLLVSNILTSKIIGYLSLYQDPNMNKEQMEDAFIQAIDTVLEKCLVWNVMYESVLDYLVGGFENYGFEKVLQHLAEYNHLDEMCENTEKKKELEHKLELISRLAVGKPAPAFKAVDLKGDTIDLYKIKSEKILLVFWASWCPHCAETLPELKKYYDPAHTGKLQIVAVSVDEDKNSWEQAIADKGYNWINIGEMKGWDGTIPEKYGVVATPTFFLLDKDKKIAAKPNNLQELESLLKNP